MLEGYNQILKFNLIVFFIKLIKQCNYFEIFA